MPLGTTSHAADADGIVQVDETQAQQDQVVPEAEPSKETADAETANEILDFQAEKLRKPWFLKRFANWLRA